MIFPRNLIFIFPSSTYLIHSYTPSEMRSDTNYNYFDCLVDISPVIIFLIFEILKFSTQVLSKKIFLKLIQRFPR